MIRLCICAGWSEASLVPHTTLLEISCHGSKRERERERETRVCIRISCNLETYHVSVLKMLLVRNSFCTTKSDIRQYWCFACFLSHAQMFKLTKHSFLNSIRIWLCIQTLNHFFFLLLFKGEDPNITKSRPSSARQRNAFKWGFAGVPMMARRWMLAW